MEPRTKCLRLTLRLSDAPARFYPVFQQGLPLLVRVNLSVREIVCVELGIAPDYLETRIQTLFLDGHPVDRLEDIVGDGAVLALSGALPGLVGATLRRGGRYAPLRAGISHLQEGAKAPRLPAPGGITLKLFNQVLDDLCPRLLSQGLTLRAGDILALLSTLLPAVPGPLAMLDNRLLDGVKLMQALRELKDGPVILSVEPPLDPSLPRTGSA
jgi:hypothetical protein